MRKLKRGRWLKINSTHTEENPISDNKQNQYYGEDALKDRMKKNNVIELERQFFQRKKAPSGRDLVAEARARLDAHFTRLVNFFLSFLEYTFGV